MYQITQLILILTLALSGCAVNPPQKLSLSGHSESNLFITDNSKITDYPGFMAGEGNIYSCHYGIAYLDKNLLTPKPASILGHHLINNYPKIDKHHVTLNRFDVFYNWKEPLMRIAKHAAAGAVSGATGTTWVANEGPLEGEVIGCKNENLGEYYRSEVPVGYAAMVTYLYLVIDGRNIQIRNVSPIIKDELPPKKEITPWIEKAILNTLNQLDDEINKVL